MQILGGSTILWTVFGGFFISVIVSLIVILLSKKFHIFIDTADSLKPQRFHTLPTPRAGGIGIFLGFFAIFFFGSETNVYFFISMAIVFFSGLLEDFSASLSPKSRLWLQLIGSAVAVFGMGAFITNLLPIVTLPYFAGIMLALFGIVGVCNAVNIIDGFNGLAGGICLMAFVCIAIVAFSLKVDFVFFASLIGIGSLIGFLVLNFPKGKIFLGDGGAYMLGFLIALLLAILTQDASISAWFGLSVMIYPVWEVIFSMIRRKKEKKSTTEPDKEHLHTLMHKKFKNNPLTSVILWGFNLPFMVLSVIFAHNAWVLIGICVVFVVLYLIIYKKLIKST